MVGNIRDMQALIRMRQMTFAENGSPPTEKRTVDGMYMTPRVKRMAPAAKPAIIRAGSRYFMAKVAIQRQAMKVQMAIV